MSSFTANLRPGFREDVILTSYRFLPYDYNIVSRTLDAAVRCLSIAGLPTQKHTCSTTIIIITDT